MAILKYAYYDMTKNRTDEEVIWICRNKINEFDKNWIAKIIDTLEINKIKLFLVIENELENGVFRLQYSDFLKLPNK